MCDYRNSSGCSKLDYPDKQKEHLQAQITKEHPRLIMFFNKISPKKSPHYRLFSRIYNNKCVYCGMEALLVGINSMEVDHYICESSFKKTDGEIDKAAAGQLDNLVLSCKMCNRSKSAHPIEGDYKNILHPDTGIQDVFERDSKFYISIKAKYINNNIIKKFHTKLKLEYEIRRLDFLLMELHYLAKKTADETVKRELESCLYKLMIKRNLIITTEDIQ